MDCPDYGCFVYEYDISSVYVLCDNTPLPVTTMFPYQQGGADVDCGLSDYQCW